MDILNKLPTDFQNPAKRAVVRFAGPDGQEREVLVAGARIPPSQFRRFVLAMKRREFELDEDVVAVLVQRTSRAAVVEKRRGYALVPLWQKIR